MLISIRNLIDDAAVVLTPSTESLPDFGVANLKAHQPGQAWRIPTLSGADLEIDMGASAVKWDVAAILYTNAERLTNFLTYAEDIAAGVTAGDWTESHLTANAGAGNDYTPDGLLHTLDEDSANDEHYLEQLWDRPAVDGDNLTNCHGGMDVSVWARHTVTIGGASRRLRLCAIESGTDVVAYQDFDLDDGSLIGSPVVTGQWELIAGPSATVDPREQSAGGLFYRFWMAIRGRLDPGGAPPQIGFRCQLLDTSGNATYIGSGGSAQVEIAAPQLGLWPTRYTGDLFNDFAADQPASLTPWQATAGNRAPSFQMRSSHLSGFTGQGNVVTMLRPLVAGKYPDSWGGHSWSHAGIIDASNTFHNQGATHHSRYHRVKLHNLDNPAGFLQVGRFWMGTSWRPELTFVPGSLDIRPGELPGQGRTVSFKVAYMTELEAFTDAQELSRFARSSSDRQVARGGQVYYPDASPILVVLDELEVELGQDFIIYGYLKEVPRVRLSEWAAGGHRYDVTIVLEELTP